MYSYSKLKGRIVELYGTQTGFAKRLGISKNSISKKLAGKTEFSQSDIEKWAELLEIEKGEYEEYFFYMRKVQLSVSDSVPRAKGGQRMRKRIREMKRNHPELFGQFLFAVTIMCLSLLQIVVVLVCAFL